MRAGDKVLPVQIHGDAAFAGQGVIMETLQLSQARGFYTGGSVHVIINNQVGFTTSDPRDARSTLYCSDVAKMVEAPIFHVNADDPEAVCFVTRFALEYRMKFHKDVVIDLVCYRRHGHNEADEPAATQPLMYQVIRKKPTARQLYADKLAAEGVLTAAEAAAMMEQYRNGLDEGKPQARAALGLIGNKFTVDWSEYLGADWSEPVKTAVDMGRLRALGKAITTYPSDWVLHPRVLAVMQARERMLNGDLALDWGAAENLAYASLVQEGYPVRLTGQDSGRGTFFHRHAVLHDQATGRRYVPLQHLATQSADVHGDRFGVVRRGGHGFRVRLLDHRTALPDDLGRAVRRFLQRRAGHHRSVHQFRRSQVGPPLRHHPASAAWLRRPGARAFLGALGALPAAVRRVQHAGVRAVDAGADVSHAAPADGAAAAQAADRHDAEEFAAPPLVGVAPGRARAPAGSTR